MVTGKYIAFLLAVLATSGCAEKKTDPRPPTEDQVIGVYVVDGTETLAEFIRAHEAHKKRGDAERRASGEDPLVRTAEARAVWLATVTEWAATYARIFRYELEEAGQFKVTVPRRASPNGEVGAKTIAGTWSLQADRVRVVTDGWDTGSNWTQPFLWSGSGFHPSSWSVFIAGPGSKGNWAVDIIVHLALEKQ